MTEYNNQPPQEVNQQPVYQQPQQQYQQQPVYVQPLTPEQQSARNMAIAGMVLGIVSLLFFWFGFLGIPCGIVGLILSIIAIKRGQKGMAIAGLVCSILGLLIGILVVITYVAMFSLIMDEAFMNMPRY